MVQDISRPDVNGVLPKMTVIGTATEILMKEVLPHVKIETSDNFRSSVVIWGSLQPKETWSFGNFQNSRHFIAQIAPKARYYTDGDPVVVTVWSSNGMSKFRKYTGTPEKVLAKLVKWIKENNPEKKIYEEVVKIATCFSNIALK